MDSTRFDNVARSLSRSGGRRSLLLGALGFITTATVAKAGERCQTEGQRCNTYDKNCCQDAYTLLLCQADTYGDDRCTVCVPNDDVCNETCGEQTNNCGQTVDCGDCCVPPEGDCSKKDDECCEGNTCHKGKCVPNDYCLARDEECSNGYKNCCTIGDSCQPLAGHEGKETCQPQPYVCTPSCDGTTCGSDGCEGTCACADGTPICNEGICEADEVCPPPGAYKEYCSAKCECKKTPSNYSCINNECIAQTAPKRRKAKRRKHGRGRR